MAPTPWLDEGTIRFMLEDLDTWAVVGLSGDPSRTAYRIARFLQDRGKRIVPVHPDAPTVLGEQGYATLADIPFAIDCVDVFRRSEAAGGIEWEDDMVEVNKITTPANTRWKLIDRSTGAENHGIEWQFTVGDRVKIRLVNEMDSDHPMHHPFHIHGAGRFLVLSRDGVTEPNLVWKDTVLVKTGEVVDILLDVTNPGRWMAHCHIAEHHESGMMFSFDVAPAEQASA